MEFRSEFILRSALGVFHMECTDSKKRGGACFAGTANGFGLEIEVAPDTGKYRALCISDSDGFGSGEAEYEGRCVSPEDMCSGIGHWLDTLCPDFFTDLSEQARYLETPRGRIAYFAYNIELGGTPALFVHGGPGGESNPEKARELMLDRPVILYDQSGCGFSDKIEDLEHWTADDYASEMNDLIEGLGLEKVIIIAASWGAGLAALYAERYGCGRIEAMVLPSPFFSSEAWSKDQMENLREMSRAEYGSMLKCVRDNDFGDGYTKIRAAYFKRYLFSKPENAEIAEASALSGEGEVYKAMWGPNDMQCTGTLRGFDVTEGLGGIEAPVLLMCGDSDQVRIPTLLRYHRKIRGSRVSVIPQAGHVLAFEQFGLYRDSIAAFLDENCRHRGRPGSTLPPRSRSSRIPRTPRARPRGLCPSSSRRCGTSPPKEGGARCRRCRSRRRSGGAPAASRNPRNRARDLRRTCTCSPRGISRPAGPARRSRTLSPSCLRRWRSRAGKDTPDGARRAPSRRTRRGPPARRGRMPPPRRLSAMRRRGSSRNRGTRSGRALCTGRRTARRARSESQTVFPPRW